MIGTPKEPDFFKSTVLGVDDRVQGLGGGCGELCHPFHGGQPHLAGVGCPNYSGEGCLDPPILLDTTQDDELKPSNGFGRGQSASSVSTGRCGGIGWKPKPVCRLLGGAGGGNTRKKMGPKAKARGN